MTRLAHTWLSLPSRKTAIRRETVLSGLNQPSAGKPTANDLSLVFANGLVKIVTLSGLTCAGTPVHFMGDMLDSYALFAKLVMLRSSRALSRDHSTDPVRLRLEA